MGSIEYHERASSHISRYWRTALVSVALITTNLTGCGIYDKRMTRIMSSWVGSPVTRVIEYWGPPDNTYDEPPFKVYVWRRSYTYGRINSSNGRIRATNGISYRMFWVNDRGLIVEWKFGDQ